MNLTNEFQPIRDWAEKRGILDSGNISTQSLKVAEEVGELAKAVIEKNEEGIIDAIGDIVVTLTSVAYFAGVPIEHCINTAYKIIANRTGAMNEQGSWVRDKE